MRMCPCLKEVPSYLSGFSAADFRTAASAGVGRLSACLVKQSFNVKNNLAELKQSGGDLSEADGDKIIRAPTVGLDLYISLSQSELPVDLPCLQMGSVTIGDVQDGTEDVPVPQFKMCRGSNLPMPNELIPYIRIQGGAAK